MTRILRMRGIPFTATEEDIHTFFSAWGLEDVRICKKSGRPTGEAYVKFKTEKGCAEAMTAKDKEKLGKRYVELFKAKDQDLEQRPSELDVVNKGHVLRMRGLPFSACVADILLFFEDIPSVDQDNVLFVYDSSGRPSGEAYVYFTDEEGCKTALKMDKKEMGSRYIELFPTHDSDIQRASRLGRLRSGKSENHPPRRLRSSAKTAPAANKSPKRSEAADPVVKAIPNYKPVAVKQLTKTFANVAASSPSSNSNGRNGSLGSSVGQAHDANGSANGSVQGAQPPREALAGAPAGVGALAGAPARAADAGAGIGAIATGLGEKLVLHESASSSLFANSPLANAAPGSGADGKGCDADGGSSNGADRQQQGSGNGNGDGQVWQQWGSVTPCGMSGLPVYDMWSNTILPKVAHPHDPLAAAFQGTLWQPSFQHMTNGVSNGAFSSSDGMYGMHNHRQMDAPTFHNH